MGLTQMDHEKTFSSALTEATRFAVIVLCVLGGIALVATFGGPLLVLALIVGVPALVIYGAVRLGVRHGRKP